MNWITDKENGLLTKIQAGNNAILAITEDYNRIKELIRYFSLADIKIGARGSKPISLPKQVLLADEWNGMRMARYSDNGIVFEPLATSEDNPFLAVTQNNLDLHALHERLKSTTTITALSLTASNPRTDLFLNAVADDDMVFTKASILIVFAPSKTLFSPTILSKVAVIDIPASTEEERKKYLNDFIDILDTELPEQEINEIVAISSGLTLRQFEIAIAESLLIEGKISKDHIRETKTELINKSDLVEVEMDMKHGFERIGGYEPLKNFVNDNIIDIIEHKEEAEKYGLRIPKGILLFGQGGTGKTVFVKALAKELSLPFIRLDPSNIFRSLVGESEQRMTRIIKLIEEMSPCIVFIDEIDSIGMSRDATALDGGATRKVFSILLSYLGSERNNLVIGTTNRPQDLDDAFRRVGRFDFTIFIPLPDKEARKEILKVHTSIVRHVPVELTETGIESISDKTEWWNGAEIENLVIRASQIAFRERAGKVTMEHFEKALGSMRIDIEERKKTEQKYIELAKKMVNDIAFIKSMEQKTVSRMRYIGGM